MKMRDGGVQTERRQRAEEGAIAALAVGASGNALLKPVIVSISDVQRCFTGDCALNFVLLFGVAVGLTLVVSGRRARGQTERPRSGPAGEPDDDAPALKATLAMVAASALLIAPFAMAAWLALAAAAHLGARSTQSARAEAGYAILFVCALRPPLGALFLGPLAAAPLAFDAAAAGLIGGALGSAVSIEGNLLSRNGHSVLILTGCTSYANIGDALVLWFAVTRPLGALPLKPFLFIAGFLCVGVMLINLMRLAAMTLSPEAFSYFHDAEGADLVTAAYGFVTAIAVFAASRSLREKCAPPS